MGEYTFRTFRKFLCATLVFSLLWPDVARCMQDDEEKDFQSSSPKILSKNISDLKEKKSSSENLKIEVEVKEEIKEIPPQTEIIQEKKEPIQPLLPKKEEIIEEKLPLTEEKPKEEELKNTKTIKTNPSHDPKKKEEKENQDTQFSNHSSKTNNPEIPIQIIEEKFSSDKVDIITTKENKRNDDSLDSSLFKKIKNKKKSSSTCSCLEGICSCFTKKKSEKELADFSEDEENTEKSSLLGKNKKVNIQEEDSLEEDFYEKCLAPLGIELEKLNWDSSLKDALKKILDVEKTWRNPLIWANLENLIHKALFALTTNKSAITKKKGEKAKKCCDPLWLYGGPVPLMDSSAIKRNVTLKTVGNAFQDGVTDTIETILTGLLGYQVHELIKTGTWKVLTFKKFIEFYEGADNTSYIAVINALSEHPALFALFAIPIGFAVIKTLWNVSHISKPTEENIKKTVENLHDPKSDKWDSKFFSLISLIPSISSLLMFHPTKSAIPGLTLPILWKGDLDSKDREEAFNTIVQVANKRGGITQMTAIESLKYLAHGMHPKNLMNIPHSVEELAKIKAGALHALKEVYKTLHPLSINKARTAMHLWEIGQSPSRAVSLIAPVIKAALAAFYGYSLYQMGRFLYDYFTCSNKYKTRFSWLNSLHPGYVNDFNKDCFDTQVKAFNTIPGQPVDTLVGRDPTSKVAGNLSSYYFPGGLYDLDISNKGLSGEVIAEIVEGFKLASAKVSLRSLNITNNAITNSSDLVRILQALPPSIINLDMTAIIPSSLPAVSFVELGRLTGLQSLNISYNQLSPPNNDVMGQVLQNLSHLRELNLACLISTNLTQVAQALKSSLRVLNLDRSADTFDCGAQIALGQALAHNNLTLHQLYLRYTGLGLVSEGNGALACGLKNQTQLRTLDLSQNFLGQGPKNVSTLLNSLPSSLTSLDVSGNTIGILGRTSEITALTHAIQKMVKLTSFKAGGQGNALGFSPDFLRAFHDKPNLTFLDLSCNFFDNITQVKNILNTTFQLEKFDISHNQLSNGSLLAPALSKLQHLTQLKLGGNDFTIRDHQAILNATYSFHLPFIFFLDTDLNFTIYYLNNLLSNTTTLNFAGLIPNDPTAFQTIMPIVVNRFLNLENLDLSNNVIVNRDLGTNKLRTGGIEALNSSLPQLKHLQSLKISYCTGSDASEADIYYQSFSQTIGQLSPLRSLDLSWTPFFFADSLGQGLNKTHSLTSVNLAGCWRSNGYWAPRNWGKQLIQGIQAHPNLRQLNLYENPIGLDSSGNPDPNSTLALADTLKSWPQLQSLNLAANYIGYQDSNSSSYFLEKLTKLTATIYTEKRTLEVNLFGGMYNVNWSNWVGAFKNFTEKAILKKCATELCTGKAIGTTQSKEKTKKLQKKQIKKLMSKKHSLQEELSIEPVTKTHELQEVRVTQPVTSSASQRAPFYQPVVNSLKSWFSLESWSVWGDRVLDSVAHTIVNYSKQVVENAPSYYPGVLDKSKSLVEGRNKTFRNYPVPHFRAIDQGEPLDVQRFNHMQVLPQSQGFNHTSSPLMISGGFQPLMITK